MMIRHAVTGSLGFVHRRIPPQSAPRELSACPTICQRPMAPPRLPRKPGSTRSPVLGHPRRETVRRCDLHWRRPLRWIILGYMRPRRPRAAERPSAPASKRAVALMTRSWARNGRCQRRLIFRLTAVQSLVGTTRERRSCPRERPMGTRCGLVGCCAAAASLCRDVGCACRRLRRQDAERLRARPLLRRHRGGRQPLVDVLESGQPCRCPADRDGSRSARASSRPST